MKREQTLMKKKEVAEELNVSLKTVQKFTRQGRLRSVKLDPAQNGTIRYRPEDVAAFISKGVR